MSLKAKMAISFLGVVVGQAMPWMVAYSAGSTSAVTGSQYNAQPSVQSSSAAPQQASAAPSTVPVAATKGKYKDQPTVQSFSWDGPYIGVYGGGAWGNSSLNTNVGKLSSTSYFTSTANIGSVNQHGTGTVMPRNMIGGIQIGNNVQSDHIVYGMVLDAGSFRLSQAKNASGVTYPTFPAQYTLKSSISTTWLASLRARLGWTTPCWPLFYITGGLAITNIHVSNTFSDNAFSLGMGGSSNTKVKPGWVVGAGIEMPVHANWTIDGEYQFVNFGSNTTNGFVTCRAGACSGTRSPFSTAANLSASMVRLGVNYKFS